MRTLIGGLLLIAVLYAALIAVMYVAQRSMQYFPGGSLPPPPPGMAAVTLKTGDGLRLVSWYAPPRAGRPVIVYFHGNGGTVTLRVPRVAAYRAAGYGVMLLEYRGYGGNPGQPTEDGLYDDARAALAFLAEQGIEPHAMVMYGESLGSGVAVRMAHETASRGAPAAALVIEAGFSSAVDLAAHHYPIVPVRWLLRDRYDSMALIGGVRTPLFMVHGTADFIAPIQYAERLFAAAAPPKDAKWIAGGGHESLDRQGGPEAVLDFLSRHVRNTQ